MESKNKKVPLTGRVAVWGTGVYGKRFCESVKRSFFGDDVSVTRIYDTNKAGMTDPVTGLVIADPENIKQDYENGCFDCVFVAVISLGARQVIIRILNKKEIPVALPGTSDDFEFASEFEHVQDPDITIENDGYDLHILKDVLCAAADSFNTESEQVRKRTCLV